MKSVVRAFVLPAIALIVSLTEAGANCDGVNQARSFVGQPPDLYFTAGVPETKHIQQTWVVWRLPLATDCQVSAKSTLQSVTVTDTYCVWSGTNCATGQAAKVDDSGGVNGVYVNYELDHVRAVPVHYDGSAPANTTGKIEFGVLQGDSGVFIALGSVNVFIVPPGYSFSNWFTITTTATNINGDSAYIDRPNLDSDSKVFAMHQYTGSDWNHPIAATFDRGIGRWKIRNEDGSPMPVGHSFVIRVDPSALKLSTGKTGSARNHIRINDPRSNNNPYATIVATPWSAGINRMKHPYAVAYTPPHWQVMFTDGKNMPRSSRAGSSGFFVKIVGASQYVDDTKGADPSGFTNTYLSNGAGIDLHAVGSARASGAVKYLRGFCWTKHVNIPALATLNLTPLPPPAPVNYNFTEAKYYGVGVSAGVSTVVHEDGSPMFGATPFNVWGQYMAGCPPH